MDCILLIDFILLIDCMQRYSQKSHNLMNNHEYHNLAGKVVYKFTYNKSWTKLFFQLFFKVLNPVDNCQTPWESSYFTDISKPYKNPTQPIQSYKNPNLAITLGECNSFRCVIKLIKIYNGRPIVNATRKNNTTGKNVDHRGLPISKLISSLKKDRPFKLITLK